MIVNLNRLFIPLILIAVISTFLFVFYFKDRVLLNVYIGNTSLTGLTRGQLESVIEGKLSVYEKTPISISTISNLDGKDITGEEKYLSLSELGIDIDESATSDKIFTFGKSGNLKDIIFKNFSLLINPKRVEPVFYFDSDKFSTALDNIFYDSTYDVNNSTLVYKDFEFIVESAKGGVVLDESKIILDIKNRINSVSSDAIIVELIEVQPNVNELGAQKALEKVNTLNNQSVELIYERQKWSIFKSDLLDMLVFSPDELKAGYAFDTYFGNRIITLNRLNSDEMRNFELNVSLDDKKLDNFIQKIASSIDKDKVDATLNFDGQKISNFKAARDGQKLDTDLTKKLVLEIVSIENTKATGEIVINLPVNVTKAKIASEEINSLGIKELIGRGVSYFRSSIPNRVHNLSLGSERISGTLVQPGDSFSFNKSIGEISGATGYKPAYIISSGRTVLDDGGGVCQVSTTVFRAALDSGLPIVERTAHAYRVSYYEQAGFKPGLDATVWSPAVDFVFKNDTDNYILVQSVVDYANSKIEVDIYGTKDNRSVELSDPIISNVKPALPDKYEDDPTLPAGTIKQVDFAAIGATSVFGRKVYKNGKLIIDELFKSNFRPWQAVYLVGTGQNLH